MPLAAALLLAACAQPGAAPSVPSAPSAPAAAAPSSAPPPSFMPLDPNGPSPDAARKLTGTVAAGVEPGCLILRTGTGDYLLLISGDRSAATPGAKVVVTGTEARDMATTCQQGTPFVVAEISAA
ncbi:hypothetical protein Sya03_53660 [Spirilliplanes yamanashiensis]|uniref:Uncharacterized protein n=1 Tax=Spirilliplanes yamanashiensis TaxID=42233 RepID=A0A8J4DMA3_9ACTN|nr:hypothetical protein Sya03_53660 [Spirilliplanes yamanashiensis]